MQAMTMTKVRDLKEGDLVDVEPALDWLANEGHSIDPIDRGLATMELAIVASVESLPPETPYELGILNNHLADYIAALHVEGPLPSMYVPDTLELPRVLRD